MEVLHTYRPDLNRPAVVRVFADHQACVVDGPKVYWYQVSPPRVQILCGTWTHERTAKTAWQAHVANWSTIRAWRVAHGDA